jgi:hypothetical protein
VRCDLFASFVFVDAALPEVDRAVFVPAGPESDLGPTLEEITL